MLKYQRLKIHSSEFVENCEWNDWQLGECSVSCGGGTRVDTRTKAKVEAYGGTCDENENQREVACNTEDCPRNAYHLFCI